MAPTTPRPVRVLCVDDNEDLADTTGEILRIIGCDVRVCYSGPAALSAASEFRPDVCLLDLNMPGMDGDVLAGRLRDQAAGRPMLFVAATAMNSEADFARTRQAGFHLHLVKPVEPSRLIGVVAALTDPSGVRLSAAPR